MLGVGEKFPGFSLIANVGVQQETAFTNLTDQDLRDFWKLYFFWPKDFAPLALTELVAFAALDYELLELNTRCVGASVESEYAHLAWRRQEPELRDYPFPLLADTKRELCGELGILNEREGVAERATFIVDPEDTIQFVYALGMEVPRDAGEVLRVWPICRRKKAPAPSATRAGRIIQPTVAHIENVKCLRVNTHKGQSRHQLQKSAATGTNCIAATNGQITGALYVANTNAKDANGNPILGAPTFNWNGGGGNGIQYDHCWADNLLNKYPPAPSTKALQALSSRMLQF